jgi:hypothetical protein
MTDRNSAVPAGTKRFPGAGRHSDAGNWPRGALCNGDGSHPPGVIPYVYCIFLPFRTKSR